MFGWRRLARIDASLSKSRAAISEIVEEPGAGAEAGCEGRSYNGDGDNSDGNVGHKTNNGTE